MCEGNKGHNCQRAKHITTDQRKEKWLTASLAVEFARAYNASLMTLNETHTHHPHYAVPKCAHDGGFQKRKRGKTRKTQ
jgi:hypothetical protein